MRKMRRMKMGDHLMTMGLMRTEAVRAEATS
jgi:hypothetical protein